LTPLSPPAPGRLIAALALVPATALIAIAAVPHVLTAPSSAKLIPIGIAALTAVYAGAFAVLWRRPARSDWLGIRIGILAGVLWSIEIYVGGPARVSYDVEQAIGGTMAAAAAILTLAAGPLVRRHRASPRATLAAGAYAGLTSGVFLFVFATLMTLLTLGALAGRSDYRHQFTTSGARTIHAFLIQDILTGASAHLVLNPLLGLVGSGLAVLMIRRDRARRADA